jgi:hypothetical protein
MTCRPMARLAWALPIALAGMAGAVQAQTWPGTDKWTYSVTPYLWMPAFKGTLKYTRPPGTGNPDVSVDERSVLDALDAAFMLTGEARRGRWSFYGDYVYLKFSTSKSAVRSVDFNAGPSNSSFAATSNTGSDSTLKGNMLTLAGGYSLAQTADSPFDVIGGLRYLGITAETSWNLSAAVAGPQLGQTFAAAGSASRSKDLFDGIIGFRGRAKIADRWYLPYYADVGTGSSNLTWQALAGISYAFGWGEVALAYRHLYYDQKGDNLMHDFKFSGPMVGATFRF